MEEHGRKPKSLSKRRRFWLEHVRRCHASAGTIKDYAATQGLTLSTLYSRRRELLNQGLLEEESRPQARFRKVAVTDGPVALQCRISLPNGVTVDWGHGDLQAMESVLRAAAALP